MVGGDLPKADEWTTSLLTNPEVIAVDQHSTGNHPVVSTDKTVVWVAQSGATDRHYLALFNLTESSQTLQYGWRDLGLAKPKYQLRDLWSGKMWARRMLSMLPCQPMGACCTKRHR